MKEHDETKLPKWAQARLTKLRMEVSRRDGLQSLHAVLCELIEIAKETWDAGEWCHLEIRDRLGKVLTALGVDLMEG